MSEPRSVVEVIEAIQLSIPADAPEKEDLASALSSLKESALYGAPENTGIYWQNLSHLLIQYLKTPDTPWKQTISGIVQGTINYKDILKAGFTK